MNLNTVIPVLANALSGKHGVRVIQGERAQTNCFDTITLPPLLEDDKNAKIKALGFVGHECAHISFTDRRAADEIDMLPYPKLTFSMHNMLEDIRIEMLQQKRFPGVAKNLDALMPVLVEEGFFQPASINEPVVCTFQKFMLYKLRVNVLGQQGLSEYAKEADAVFNTTFNKGLRIKLEALMFQIVDANNTYDAVVIAKQIMQELIDHKPEEEDDGADDQIGGASSPGSGNQSDDVVTDDTQSDVGDSTSGVADDAMAQVIQQLLDASEDDLYKDLGDVLSESIDSDAQRHVAQGLKAGQGPMRIFNADVQKTKGANPAFDADSKRVVNALRQKLRSMIQAQTFSSTQLKDSGTKISARHLHTLRVGGKVFEKVADGVDVDLAFTVLIDVSDSMRKNIDKAGLAGYALAEAMASIHGVVASAAIFPTLSGIDYLSYFGDKPVLKANNYASIMANGSTPLSDAMAKVGIDLAQQHKAKKILVVITDGEPDDGDQSDMVLDALAQTNIEVIGLGIGVDLSAIFQKWTTITSIDALPQEMFSVLQKNLKLAA